MFEDISTYALATDIAQMLVVAISAFGLGYLKGLTDGIDRGLALRPAHKRTESLLDQRPADTTRDLLARMPGTPLPTTDDSDDSDTESETDIVKV
jgi:hypothetical protein